MAVLDGAEARGVAGRAIDSLAGNARQHFGRSGPRRALAEHDQQPAAAFDEPGQPIGRVELTAASLRMTTEAEVRSSLEIASDCRGVTMNRGDSPTASARSRNRLTSRGAPARSATMTRTGPPARSRS